MGNPEAPTALPIADNLDETHHEAAVRNGSEALSALRQLEAEAKARRLAASAEAAMKIKDMQTV